MANCTDPKTVVASRQAETAPSVGTPGSVTLQIYSYITKQTYKYKAYIYNFSQNITTTVSDETPFGRSSRIYTYGGTVRQNIDVSFYELVNSTDTSGVQDAYYRAQQTMQAMYPQYKGEDAVNSLYLQKAPLFRVYCPAYITNGGKSTGETISGEVAKGLLCYITNLQVSVDRSADGAFKYSNHADFPSLSPKINYSMQLAPIEDSALGFDESGNWAADSSWPMGFEAPASVSSAGTVPTTSVTDANDASADQANQNATNNYLFTTQQVQNALDPN